MHIIKFLYITLNSGCTKPLFEERLSFALPPDETTGIAEIRIWYKDILTDVYQVNNSDLNLVHF